ncbi:sigma 54-interacting transcriptional regulator [Marinobacteraceae bacterium S3BR75-40.1]
MKGFDSLRTGIELAVRLARPSTPSGVQAQFVRQLQKLFGLPGFWCLELTPSGRQLVQHDGEGQVFDCDDFSHPFAHAVRDGHERRLDASAPRHLDHPGFRKMAGAVPASSGWLVTPVSDSERRLLGVLVIAAPAEPLDRLMGSGLYPGLCDLLALHWRRCLDRTAADKAPPLARHHSAEPCGETPRDLHAHPLEEALVGVSDSVVTLRELLRRGADSDRTLLISGETGCGKRRVAETFHRISDRAEGPFVALNCDTLPDHLLEAELFGQIEGGSSARARRKPGLMARAEGGTLFLSGIETLAPALQARLLGALETGRYRPVGAQKDETLHFHLIAASCRPLDRLVAEGRFRPDLYFRLNQIPVRMVPLRERLEDLEPLCRHFIRQFRQRMGRGAQRVSRSTLALLRAYSFPGNVRELQTLTEFACLQAGRREELQPEDFPLNRQEPVGKGDANEGGSAVLLAPERIGDLRQATRDFEALVILDRLRQHQGNRARAAASLGLPKRTLAHKCLKMRLDV